MQRLLVLSAFVLLSFLGVHSSYAASRIQSDKANPVAMALDESMSKELPASANAFVIDDEKTEALIQSAIPMESKDVQSPGATKNATKGSERSPFLAFLLSCIPYFTLISGIHRLYLGTSTTTFILYFCTLGGLGCLSLIDSILLLMAALSNDLKGYEDNDHFFMWEK